MRKLNKACREHSFWHRAFMEASDVKNETFAAYSYEKSSRAFSEVMRLAEWHNQAALWVYIVSVPVMLGILGLSAFFGRAK